MHMTYTQAMEWLSEISKKGGCLGLERMRLLMRELGDPQDELKFIHIAGTNGKGSVMTFLEHTLVLAGLRVGRYLSPAVFSYEEKIRVNEEYIPGEKLAGLCGILREACRRMEKAGEEVPTVFEVETALALYYFRECGCEIVLLETGMGGETDATNIVENTALEIFSSISLDHMEYLGDTPEKIAAVKAGILKKGSVAVSDVQSPGVQGVLEEKAREMGVPICFVDRRSLTDVTYSLSQQFFSYRSTAGGRLAGMAGRRTPFRDRMDGLHENMQIGMAGTWQVENACAALEAVDALRSLGYDLDEETVKRGFAGARIEGRFEIVHREPLVIMDGAHNPEAAERLAWSVRTYFPAGSGRKIFFVLGVFADKDYRREIELTAPLAHKIFTVRTKDNPRAMDADRLAGVIREYNPNVVSAGSVRRGLDMALAQAGREDVIVLFGSLSWLGEAREYLGGISEGSVQKPERS